MLSGTFLSLAAFVALAAAGPIEISTFAGEKTGRYIVKFKEGASASAHLANFRSASTSSNITHEYKDSFFNGFAGKDLRISFHFVIDSLICQPLR